VDVPDARLVEVHADAERYRRAEETLEELRREWSGEPPKKVVPLKKKATKRKRG
jgi:alkanesulfonate monooxygenase SsuD/methylene tetrahydromethanopterin reductase-like flavin-dependent oxidoreductase (luciferase family)